MKLQSIGNSFQTKKIKTVQLYSVDGKLLKTSINNTITLSEFTSGNYLVKILLEDEKQITKKNNYKINTMKKIFLFLLIPLLTMFSIKVHANCPVTGSVSVSATSTPRTCGGNGTITVTFSPTAEVALQLLKGGTIISQVGAPPALSSPYTWTALQPGTDYQVRIICAENNSIIYQTVNVTVADNYAPITNTTISVTNVCTNFTPGGTFTINGITGGNAPYEYSVVKSNDPTFIDVIPSNYTTNNVWNVTEFGTYQIRVKDACGGYATFSRTITPTIDPIRFYWRSQEVCGSTQVEGSIWFATNHLTGGNADESEFLATGLKLKIQADNASGAVLFEGTYTGTPFTYTPSASHSYYVTATNACGASVSYTHNLIEPASNPEFFNFIPTASTNGCGLSATETLSINFGEQYFWKYPLTIVVKNSAGVIVNPGATFFNGTIWALSGLPLDTYTITVSDSCSPANSLTKTVDNPEDAGSPVLSLHSTPKWRCEGGAMALTDTGTIQAVVQISGYFPNNNNAVVTITAGPSHVGENAVLVDEKYWGWPNLTVGTYIVSYTSCGVPRTGTFTINSNTSVLEQSLSSTSVSTCNSGGIVTSNRVYNGAYPYTVELVNSLGVVVDSSNTGNFNNIAPGTYATRLKVMPCGIISKTYYISGSTFTIINSSTGPKITASTGIICEDSTGNPVTTGSAYLDIAGVAPYTIEYRVEGSAAPYTVINTSGSSVQINNLTANIIYEVVLKDACGGYFPTTMQIKTMSALNGANTTQPCNNAPYTLTIPYYAGASYEWTNPAGTVISNTRTHTFANYTASDNGTYVCKITWTNCVTRFVNVTLDSTVCGGPINVCYKPATTIGTLESTKHGITSLRRAGAENGNWPMIRNGAWTALEAKTKGFVINRIETTALVQAIPNPVEGMMVFDKEADCLKINTDGTSTGWKCFNTQTCP